jgi:LuxR family maltose regulon positive regulatory protein
MLAVLAAFLCGTVGSPVEAERWADVVDRWQYDSPARPDDPRTEAWAAVLRACMCRRGAGQMRADADEAVRRCAEEGILAPGAVLLQGTARVLCGDPDAADAYFEDAASGAQDVDAHEVLASALSERSLVAMARGEWRRAEALAGQARTVLREAGIEEGYATPLVCAVQVRTALRRGDVPAARAELVSAQRLRAVLTYALPHVAVQARIEMTRAYLALSDFAGARTLMREIDELLKRRPDLGTLVGEADALRARLARERGASVPGASALTAAELRLLPLLSTHLSFAEIAAELFVSPNTAKTHAVSIYRKLDAGTRGQAVARARELGLLEG